MIFYDRYMILCTLINVSSFFVTGKGDYYSCGLKTFDPFWARKVVSTYMLNSYNLIGFFLDFTTLLTYI